MDRSGEVQVPREKLRIAPKPQRNHPAHESGYTTKNGMAKHGKTDQPSSVTLS